MAKPVLFSRPKPLLPPDIRSNCQIAAAISSCHIFAFFFSPPAQNVSHSNSHFKYSQVLKRQAAASCSGLSSARIFLHHHHMLAARGLTLMLPTPIHDIHTHSLSLLVAQLPSCLWVRLLPAAVSIVSLSSLHRDV